MKTQERYSLHYLKWHEASENHYLMHMKFIKEIKKYLPNEKDTKILDVGCGIGCVLFCLKELGYRKLKGIEVDRELVEIGKKTGIDIEFVEDSVVWLKERKEEFDVVLLLDVLEHLAKDNQIELLKAIHNSLKREGKLILTVPNANSPFACRWRYIDFTHTTSYTEHSIQYVLQNSGFKKIIIEDIIPFNKLWFFKKFTRAIYRIFLISEFGLEGFKIPLSLNLLVVAWK